MAKLRAVVKATEHYYTYGEIFDSLPKGTKIILNLTNETPGNPYDLAVWGVADRKPKCGYDCPNVPVIPGNPATAIKLHSRNIRVTDFFEDGSCATEPFYIYFQPSSPIEGTPPGWYIECRVVDADCNTYVREAVFLGYTYQAQLTIDPAPPPGTYRLYFELHGQFGPWWYCLARTEFFLVVPAKPPSRLEIKSFNLYEVHFVTIIPILEKTRTLKPGKLYAPGIYAELDSPLPRDGNFHIQLSVTVDGVVQKLLDTYVTWKKGTKTLKSLPLNKVMFKMPDLGLEPGQYSGTAELVAELTY